MNVPIEFTAEWISEPIAMNVFNRCLTDYEYHGKVNRDDDDADFYKIVRVR